MSASATYATRPIKDVSNHEGGHMSEELRERPLYTVKQAAQLLRVSKSFLYRLPPGTPGVYCLGRSKRFDVDILKRSGGSSHE